MKKTLCLLTLSLLLVAAMILGVSAKVESTDVGLYIRFDSAESIAQYVTDATSGINMDFDAEKGAMHYTAAASDQYFKVGNFTSFDAVQYPYMRITYMADRKIDSIYLIANGTSILNALSDAGMVAGTDKWSRFLYDWRKISGVGTESCTLNDLRLDIPNDNVAAELWIYDIGFFKTIEAAQAYKHNQSNVVLDMTDPAVVDRTSGTSGGKWYYDEELGAAKFVHDQATYIPDNPETEANDPVNVDARARIDVAVEEYFSLENYPYGNIMALAGNTDYTYAQAQAMSEQERNETVTGVIPYRHYLINEVSNSNLKADIWSGCGGGTQYLINNKGFTWQFTEFDLSANVSGKNGSVVVRHVFDPIDKNADTTGKEYRAYKYIAYYATAEEAALETQGAPRGLEGVMPADAANTGKITGLDAGLSYEYRVSGNANAYTAVAAGATEITGLAGGKTYDVRLAGEEGVKNPGYAAEVTVPAYTKFVINSVEGVNDAVITETSAGNWKVELPIGTNLSAVKLNTTAYYGANNATVTAYGDSNRASIGALNVSENVANETPVELALYYTRQLYMPITVTFALKGAEGGAQSVVELIANQLEDVEINEQIFVGITTSADAKAAIEAAAGIAITEASLPGLDIEVSVESFEAATAGTAEDIDGEDQSLTYKFIVSYQGATDETEIATLAVPAAHFRVLWKFNDQELANKFGVSGPGFVKTADNKLPIIKDGDKYYMRAEIAEGGKNGGDGYIMWTAASDDAVKSGDYTAMLNADDYPYVVFSYRSSEAMPSASSGSGIGIYWATSFNILNNTFVGDADNPVSGIYYGYKWARNQGYWNVTGDAAPKNTAGTKLVIDYPNGTSGVNLASSGAVENPDGSINYNATVKYPWRSDLVSWRMDISKSANVAEGEYFDLEYVAFFATKAEAEAFAGEVAFPFDGIGKEVVEVYTLPDIDGLEAGTEEAVANAVEADFVEQLTAGGYAFTSVHVDTVSYTGYNLAESENGELKYTVTVIGEGPLGDRDTYTSAVKTTVITVPDLDVQDAIDEINALKGTDVFVVKGIKTEQQALDYIAEVIAPIIDRYNGIEFEITGRVEFVAPAEGETGNFSFEVRYGNNYVTEDIPMVLIGPAKPIIFNFANPITRTNFTFTATGRGKTITAVENEDALGGAVAKYVRPATGPEFNLNTKMGINGMPAIEELSDYQVIVYRYKAPNNLQNQIYYYTDSYTGGNMYYNLPLAAGTTDEWYTHYVETGKGGAETPANSVVGDGSWANALESIRFDFYRAGANHSLENNTLEIDYIGFFADREQADAFVANPTMADYNPAALKAQYQAYLDIVDDVENTEYTVTSAMNEGGFVADAQYIVDKYFGLPEDTEYYIVIKDDFTQDEVTGKSDTEYDDFTAIDGQFTFTVAFANHTTNGNVVESKEFTVNVIADHRRVDLYENGTDETIGKFIRIGTLMDKDWMANVKDNGTLTYGMLITSKAVWDEIKADYEDGFTHEVAGILNAGEDKFVQDVEFVNIYAQDNDKNTITHTARIAVPAGQEDTFLYARAYVKYTFDGVEVIDYFGASEVSFNNPDPNAR
ncbi:MAG: hypothetical protein E7588_05450 [Ruminococcaceae bacterium]|nr:hypothetical protein [Oscillospiraceae bacterium]